MPSERAAVQSTAYNFKGSRKVTVRMRASYCFFCGWQRFWGIPHGLRPALPMISWAGASVRYYLIIPILFVTLIFWGWATATTPDPGLWAQHKILIPVGFSWGSCDPTFHDSDAERYAHCFELGWW